MRYVKVLLLAFIVLLLLAACSTLQPEAFPDASPSFDITTQVLEASVIDFEGLAEGMVVDSVSAGAGVSGFDAGGAVTVFGDNPDFATNAAIIFDATCGGAPATCSGGVYAPGEQGTVGPFLPGNGNNDDDLYNPSFGNVLILAENLVDANSDTLIDDPDDADVEGRIFVFDFSGWGDGTVVIGALTLKIVDYLDIDGSEGEDIGAWVRLRDSSDALLAEYPIFSTGDGGQDTVYALINQPGVAKLTVNLQGSGAIDNITFATDVPGGGEGCTPGYWKQRHHFDSWVGYDPSDDFDTVFGVTSSFGGTLLDALKRGGGGENALGRHAVAALLNTSSGVDYHYGSAEVIAMVQEAYAGGQFNAIKNLFEIQNEMGCPLN